MTGARLEWLLADSARETPGVVQVVVVSADGLRLATSPGMDDGPADQLSAAASGLISLARGTAHLLRAGPATQTIPEMGARDLFVTAISQGATLAVHTGRRCEIGVVGYEMTMPASRVGRAPTAAARADIGGRTQ